MATPEYDVELFSKEYARLFPIVDKLRRQLLKKLFKPLMNSFPDYETHKDIILGSRTKTVESFTRKAEERSEEYKDPIIEMSDLIAFRYIIPYADQINVVRELLDRKGRSMRKVGETFGQNSNHPRFGYDSLNLKYELDSICLDKIVASIKDADKLSEEFMTRFRRGLRIEVQVRTFAQHAWTVVSHRLEYKPHSEYERLPPELKKRFLSLNALMFLADENFIILREKSAESLKDYRSKMGREDFDIPIWLSSVKVYVEQSKSIDRLTKIAYSAGCTKHENNRGSLMRIVNVSELIRIRDLSDIESVIKGLSDVRIRKFFEEFCRYGARKRSPAAILALILLGLNYENLKNPSRVSIKGHKIHAAERIFAFDKKLRDRMAKAEIGQRLALNERTMYAVENASPELLAN